MYKNKEKIAILLSTYNGEKYITEQLQSLLNQTLQAFTIYIRDDGSIDSTLKICQQFRQLNPSKIVIAEDNEGNIGAKRSFDALLSSVESTYYMFCDQDDVWLSHKIDDSLGFFESNLIDDNKPMLIYTDALIVDSELAVMHASLITYQGKNPNLTFRNSIFNGVALGCTMFFNHALKEVACPISEQAVMHDSWITKVAIAVGEVHYLDIPTIQYRQHDNNVYGLEKSKFLEKLKSPRQAIINSQGYLVYKETLEVLDRFSHSKEQIQLQKTLTEPSSRFLFKLRYLVRHKYVNKFLLSNYKGLLLVLARNT